MPKEGSPMNDSKTVLLDQIALWKSRQQEARETLRIADAVLPGLEESLAQIERQEGAVASAFVISAPFPLEESPSVTGLHQNELRNSESVQRAIKSILSALPSEFTQNDVEDALQKAGFGVNRSTLRANLLLLARIGEGLEVLEEGRGRRATIFQKL